MDKILNIFKRIIPRKLLNFLLPIYHITLGYLSAFWYGFPSNKMIVIGVTGTKGKSTTTELIAKVLEQTGYKIGVTSTVKFKIGDKEWLNDKKMTMLGRFALQKLLKKMKEGGCKYAIIETSSEGIKQFRHKGINYDYGVFTNLTPEHIEAHGGFEKYKKAKLKLFEQVSKSKRKQWKNNNSSLITKTHIEKVIIANGDDAYSQKFLNFDVEKKFIFYINSFSKHPKDKLTQYFSVTNIQLDKNGSSFSVDGNDFKLNLVGLFNIYNAIPAIIVGINEGLDVAQIKVALEKVEGIPGRMEFINEGQLFKIIVDYAHEPESMKQLYKTVKILNSDEKPGKIIHVFGSSGGCRDKVKRPILGHIAGENADYVIVTNEDSYDDDPMEIINEIAEGIELKPEKNLNPHVFKIVDRKEAIKKALSLARGNDIVLITGKGTEQLMYFTGGKKIPWDDRKCAREALYELNNFKI